MTMDLNYVNDKQNIYEKGQAAVAGTVNYVERLLTLRP
jgi:hypothetical protein